MPDQGLLSLLETWIEVRFGVPLSSLSADPVPVFTAAEDAGQGVQFTASLGNGSVAAVKGGVGGGSRRSQLGGETQTDRRWPAP